MKFVLLSIITISLFNFMHNIHQEAIKKIWVLKIDVPQSPWNSKSVPMFLDFEGTANTFIKREYSNETIVSCEYKIEGNYILFNKDMNYRIVSLSTDNLVLQIGKGYYSYYSLNSNEKYPISNENKIIQYLIKSESWNIGGDTLKFTKDKEDIAFVNNVNFYSCILYKGIQKDFGLYTIDIYKGHVFLHIFIIDELSSNKTIELLTIDEKSIKYKKTGEATSLIGVIAESPSYRKDF